MGAPRRGRGELHTCLTPPCCRPPACRPQQLFLLLQSAIRQRVQRPQRRRRRKVRPTKTADGCPSRLGAPTARDRALLGAAVRRGGRALRGEAGTWRGKRVATWIPGCPARSGQAARQRGRRQDRTTPSTSLAIDQKRGLSGGGASWPFGNIAKRWPLRSPSGLDELVRAVWYRNTDSD